MRMRARPRRSLLNVQPVDAALVVTVYLPTSGHWAARLASLRRGFNADFPADCRNEPLSGIPERMAFGAAAGRSVPSRRRRILCAAACDSIHLAGYPDFNTYFKCPRARFCISIELNGGAITCRILR